MKTVEPTILDVIKRRAAEQPTDPAVTFMPGDGDAQTLTYEALWQRAAAVAELAVANTKPGDTVLLLYRSSLEFVEAFVGCLLAGRIAIPAAIPRNQKAFERTIAIAADGQASAVMTTASLVPRLNAALSEIPKWRPPALLVTDVVQLRHAGDESIDAGPSDVAFLQYTSGSTAKPKGVMVTHANLTDNLSRIRKDFGFSRSTCFVNWLPAYHDMGLIGGILEPLFAGCRTVLMSPQEFIQRPVRWLQLITEYGGTISGAPNFAYEACIARVSAKQMRDLDLSSWRVAFNGSEPIRADVLDKFASKFAACGFDSNALLPCYGLAEATLLVSSKGGPSPSPRVKLDRGALQSGQVVEVPEEESGRTLVSCGRLIEEHSIAVVDPETGRPCSQSRVGEIWLSGPSVAQGYWQREKETRESFWAQTDEEPEKRFLRTGDLGFVREGELYIAGRLKNIVIIRGLNYACEDIEDLAQASHPGLQGRLGAAFGIEDEEGEALVLLQETGRRLLQDVDPRQVQAAIQQAVVTHCGIRARGLVLVESGSLPRTTSGKVQRHRARDMYLSGAFTSGNRADSREPPTDASKKAV